SAYGVRVTAGVAHGPGVFLASFSRHHLRLLCLTYGVRECRGPGLAYVYWSRYRSSCLCLGTASALLVLHSCDWRRCKAWRREGRSGCAGCARKWFLLRQLRGGRYCGTSLSSCPLES